MTHTSTIFRKAKNVICPYCGVKSRVTKNGDLHSGCSHIDKYYMAGNGYVYKFSIVLRPPRYTKVGRILQDKAVKKMRSDIHDKLRMDEPNQIQQDRDTINDFIKSRYSRDTKKTKRYYADDLSDYLRISKWNKKIRQLEMAILNLKAVKQYEITDQKLGPLVKQIKEIKRKMREAKRREKYA